jgi:hypothetical protein
MPIKATLTGLIIIALGAGIFGLKAALVPEPEMSSSPLRPITVPISFREPANLAEATTSPKAPREEGDSS